MRMRYLLPVIFACLLQLCIVSFAAAQNIAINTTGFNPAASAMLDIQSNNRGLLIPQVNLATATDATTVASPAHSLLVYNTNAALAEGKGYYFNSGTTASPLWVKLAVTGTFWRSSGNTGTSPGTDFVGTNDGVGLMGKVNNVQSFYLDHKLGNVSFGQSSLLGNTTGYRNVAIGDSALRNNSTGISNTAVGNEALFSSTTAFGSTAIGYSALRANTTGSANTAVGRAAAASTTTGASNVSVGVLSLTANTIGNSNTALGTQALQSNTAGGGNVAIGHSALSANTTGLNNIGIGNAAGFWNNIDSNRLFINSQSTASYADDTTKSIIYGVMNSTTTTQRIRLNARIFAPQLSAAAANKAVRWNSATKEFTYADTTASGWGFRGNAGTTAGTDFIGTTDAKDLVIKTNGTTRINIGSAGTTTIGDGANNTKIEADGSLLFEGTATAFGDIVTPLYNAKPGVGASQPGWEKIKDNGAGSTGVYSYSFSKANEQEVFFSVQLPHNWKEGSAIFPHVHWLPQTTGQSGNIVWGIEYTWVNHDATSPVAFPNTEIISATSATVNGTANVNQHLITAFAALTPNNNQDKISSVLMCRFFRKATDVADTYSGNAAVLSVDFHYEIDAIGSRTEYVK